MPSASAPELPVAVLMGLMQALRGVEGRAQRGPQGGGLRPPPFPRRGKRQEVYESSRDWFWFIGCGSGFGCYTRICMHCGPCSCSPNHTTAPTALPGLICVYTQISHVFGLAAAVKGVHEFEPPILQPQAARCPQMHFVGAMWLETRRCSLLYSELG